MGCCCGLLIIIAVARGLPDLLLFSYIVLEAWNDGFPLGTAIKDACFELSEVKFKYFSRLGGHLSKVAVPVEATDDQTTAVCKAALYLKHTEVPHHLPIFDTADPVSTEERLTAFLDACRTVVAGLAAGDPAHSTALRRLRPSLGIPMEVVNLTAPFYHGPQTQDEYEQLKQRRDAVAAERPELSPRWQPLDQWEPQRQRAAMAELFEASPEAPRPVRPEAIPAADVAEAIWQGKVAVFDATELLPKELFNKSMAELVAMQGDEADKVWIYRQRGASATFGAQTLGQLRQRFELLARAGKLYHSDQAPLPRVPGHVPAPPAAWWLRCLGWWTRLANPSLPSLEFFLHYLRRWLTQPTIPVRRFPRLPAADFERALGSPAWLERAWSMFWCGAVGLWWHNDEPDNLLIALNGEMTVAVFEQADTDLISGLRGPVSFRSSEFFDLEKFHPETPTTASSPGAWLRKFPFTRVHLKPGMGVTVPSRTYHGIWAEDADRILINAFLIPKFQAMWDSPAANTSFFGKGNQHEDYMALLHLKFLSIFHLWDTRRLGGFFEMAKLEVL